MYKRNRSKMEKVFADEKFFDDYQAELQKLKRETLKKYTDVGCEVIDNVEGAGLSVENTFKGKSRSIMSYFKKLRDGKFADDIANKTVMDCMESVEAWVKPDSVDYDVAAPLVEEYLMP